LSTSSDVLAERTQILLLNWGILSRRHAQAHKIWNIHITGSSAVQFSKKIGFGLVRKQLALESYVKTHKWFRKEFWEDEVVSLEPGVGDVYDISVSETHKYAAAGFVHHNSFWHAELMLNYNTENGMHGLTPEEHLDFSKAHAGVVNPGFKQKVVRPDGKIEYIGLGFNPYYVGFRVFGDIKKRWDEYYEAGKKDAAFQKSDEIDHYDAKDDKVVMSKMTGMQKIRQVMIEDDDISFITGYLTRELSEDMELFTYGYRGVSENPDEDDIIIKDRELDVIQRAITENLHNNGVPIIWIAKADDKGLHLKHDPADKMPLDDKYAEETVAYIYKVWKKPVFLETHDRFGATKTIVHDDGGAKVATQKDGAVTVEI